MRKGFGQELHETSSEKKVCSQCRSQSVEGKTGPAGSVYGNTWFCQACWDAWDSQYCSRCGRHAADAEKDSANNWVCRSCVRKSPAKDSQQTRPKKKCLEKCARPDCPYLEHSTIDIPYCCRCCMEGDNPNEPHGTACEGRPSASRVESTAQQRRKEDIANKDLDSMPVALLRRECEELGIDLSGCVEKQDIVSRLRAVVGPRKPPTIPQGQSTVRAAATSSRRLDNETEPSEAMTVRQLRQLCQSHGIDVSGCVEKADIMNRFRAGVTSAASVDNAVSGQVFDPLVPDGAPLIESASSCADEESEFDSEDAEEIDMDAVWRASRNTAQQGPDAAASVRGSGEPVASQSLCAAVKACDVQAVKRACEKLGPSIADAVDEVGGMDWTPLHLCASACSSTGAAQVASLLLQYSAQPDAEDACGCVPLELAVSIGITALEDQYENVLQTIQSLLAAPIPTSALVTWRSSKSALAKHAATAIGSKLVHILQESGADLPWHSCSLRAGVEGCNLRVVEAALSKLGGNSQGNHTSHAVRAVDSNGDTLLHICAVNITSDATKKIVRLLTEHSADVNRGNAEGLVPLQVAVDQGVFVTNSEASLDSILAFLLAGASANIIEGWRFEDCALASAVRKCHPSGNAIADLLLEFGADLPWHPLSLETAVNSCDATSAETALENLGDHASAALERKDSEGRTMLHLCALGAARPGAGDLCKCLLRFSASAEAEDASGNPPLALAVAATLEILPESLSAASLDVLRVLLSHPPRCLGSHGQDIAMPQLPWCSATSPLAKSASSSPGKEIVELLTEFDVRLSCLERMQEVRARSADYGIPVDFIGVDAASNVLRECDARQDMNVQKLREECKSRKLASDVGAEKSDLVRFLQQARIDEEMQAVQAPSMKFVGTWCYGKQPNEYNVIMGADSQLHFDGPNPVWGRLAGILQIQSNGRLLANLTGKQSSDMNVDVGSIRLSYSDEDRTMTSNFKSMAMPNWGRDIIARKAASQTAWEASRACNAVPETDVDASVTISEDTSGNCEREDRVETADAEACTSVSETHVDANITTSEDAPRNSDRKDPAAKEDSNAGNAILETDASAYLAASEEDAAGNADCRDKQEKEDSKKCDADPEAADNASMAASEDVAENSDPKDTEEKEHRNADGEQSTSKVDGESNETPPLDTDDELYSSFMAAVNRHDMAAVAEILDHASLECEDDGENGVLALVSAMDLDGNTALHHCATGEGELESGNASGVGIAELLINSRADVNEVNLLGETPLLIAACGPTPLDLVNVLLSAQADPGASDSLTGETALMEAACRGNVMLCQALLDAKADLAQKSSRGLTAHDLAAQSGRESVCNLFASVRQAAINEIIKEKAVELQAAVHACDVEAVRIALHHLGDHAEIVVDPTKTLDEGCRALLHTCAVNATKDDAGEIVRLLLEHAARVDWKDANGKQPLELAVAAGIEEHDNLYAALDTIRVLLVADAPVDICEWQDPNGDLARACAKASGASICDLLQAFGASLPWYRQEEPDIRSESASRQQEDTNNQNEPEIDETMEEDSTVLQARCAEQGIPLDLLGAKAAKRLSQDCARWQQMRVSELREECELQDLATSDCLEKGDFLARLKQVRIWAGMPLESLESECIAQGISMAFDFAPREDLELALRRQRWGVRAGGGRLGRLCVEKGIPIERLGLEIAAEVLKDFCSLENSSQGVLKNECRRWDLALEAGIEKDELVKRLKKILVWQALPPQELHKELEAHGVDTSELPKDLLHLLIARTWPTVAAESRYKNFFESKEPKQKASGQQQRPTPTPGWSKGAGKQFPSSPPPRFFNASTPPGWGKGAGKNWHQHQQRPPRTQQAIPSINSYFKTLGLPPTANHQEVRQAYRKLALRYHPDKNREAGAEKVFRDVQEAYDKICEHLQSR